MHMPGLVLSPFADKVIEQQSPSYSAMEIRELARVYRL